MEQKNKTADAQFLQAQQMATIGQTEDAINKITELSKQYPENPQYRNWLKVQQDREESTRLKNASLLVEQQDFAAAEATYQKILLENPYQQAAMDGLERTRQAQNHAMMLANAQAAYGKQEITTAQNLVRAILAEDSQHLGAKRLYEKIDQQRADKINTCLLYTSRCV